MRVYVPATLDMLAGLVADGALRPVSGTAFAVTPRLREGYAEGDDEELAEVARGEAAMASIRLLAANDHDGASALPVRRVVVVADAESVTLRPDLDDAVVRLAGPVQAADVVAVFVDIADAEPLVVAAIAVIDEADLGVVDADLIVGDAQDCDMAWYAPQELPFLLELL